MNHDLLPEEDKRTGQEVVAANSSTKLPFSAAETIYVGSLPADLKEVKSSFRGQSARDLSESHGKILLWILLTVVGPIALIRLISVEISWLVVLAYVTFLFWEIGRVAPGYRVKDFQGVRRRLEVNSEGGQVVGVAYSAGLWRYLGDAMWDMGTLQLREGRLIFKGMDTQFEIPACQLRHLRVAEAVTVLGSRTPIIAAEWIDDSGQSNHLKFELRETDSLSNWWKGTQALADGMIQAGQEYPTVKLDKSKTPIPSSKFNFAKSPAGMVRKMDYLLAIAFVAGVSGALLLGFAETPLIGAAVAILPLVLHVGLRLPYTLAVRRQRSKEKGMSNSPL